MFITQLGVPKKSDNENIAFKVFKLLLFEFIKCQTISEVKEIRTVLFIGQRAEKQKREKSRRERE